METNNFNKKKKLETETDNIAARCYFPMLKEIAQSRSILTYKEFNELAKSIYPDIKEIQKAAAINLGRRFEYIRLYLIEHDLPDLSAWIVNSQYESAPVYKNDFDPNAEQERSKTTPWDLYPGDPKWGTAIQLSNEALGFLKQRTVQNATRLMARMAIQYKDRLDYKSKKLVSAREEILSRLMAGEDPDEVFSEYLTPEKK